MSKIGKITHRKPYQNTVPFSFFFFIPRVSMQQVFLSPKLSIFKLQYETETYVFYQQL